MKKILFGISVGLLILMSLFSVATASSTAVSVDGYLVSFNKDTGYPFVDGNSRTMVPLRITMESAGAEVGWEGTTRTASVNMNGTTVQVPIGHKYILRDGNKVEIDTSAVIKDGRTYLPIRAVLESFGAVVSWDGAKKMVIVNTQASNSKIYRLENAKTINNFWNIYLEGVDAKSAGNYPVAVQKLEQCLSSLLATDTKETVARVLGHLGEAYARNGQYSDADAAFQREAYYWGQVSGADAIQAKISAERKSLFMNQEMTLYVKTDDKTKALTKNFGAVHEPINGALLGAFAEGEPLAHDKNNIENRFYVYDFKNVAGKDHGIYLLYYPYGTKLSHYESHLSRAAEEGKIIELALEPYNGMQMVYSNPDYLIRLAKDMEAHDCDFMLRFANEMNSDTNGWYTADANEYIEAFRYVAKIFKKHAPSVPIVWSPLWYPPDNIDMYYPGDEYVDYVGMSSYQSWLSSVDPMGEDEDRRRWSQQLDFFYKKYGYKKPMIIAEGGASYRNPWTWSDNLSDYATYQIQDFYTYLPMRYPNIKMVVYFDYNGVKADGTVEPYAYQFTQHQNMWNAYKEVIRDEYYLTDISEGKNVKEYYYPVYGSKILPKVQELNLYVKYPKDRQNGVGRVEYFVNGNPVGTASKMPYSANVDFSQYSGQNIEIKAVAYDPWGYVINEKRFSAIVE